MSNPQTYERMLGDIAALRNKVARLREIPANLELANWDNYSGMILALIGPLDDWLGETYPKLIGWFAWADEEIQAATIDAWLNYRTGWRKIPTVPYKEDAVNYYLVCLRQPNKSRGTYRKHKETGTEYLYFKTVRYYRGTLSSGPVLDEWHKVKEKPFPSESALKRAGRMWLYSQLLHRRILTTKQLQLAEVRALLNWLYQTEVYQQDSEIHHVHKGIHERSLAVLRRLLVDYQFRSLLRLQPVNDPVLPQIDTGA